MSWVKVKDDVTGTGVMTTVFVAGVLTPAMLKPMVWAEALFKARIGEATPLVKVTLIVLGDAVSVVSLKLPQVPSAATV